MNNDYTLLWYGAGNYTIDVLEQRRWLEHCIEAFIDNDERKQVNGFRGKPVIKPENINMIISS